MRRHEVDRLGRDELGRADEVAFVLSVFVVRDDDEPPLTDIFNRLFYGSKCHLPFPSAAGSWRT